METENTLLLDEELKKKYEIKIPEKRVQEEMDKITAELQPKYRLNGFRIGKVPISVIKGRETLYLFRKATDNLLNGFIDNFTKEKNYAVATQPKVNIRVMEDGKPLEFEITYELLPDMANFDLKKLKINRYKISVSEEDMERSLDKILSIYREWKPKDGVSELGDSLRIDFVGSVNGEEFPGGKAENYQLELGSHSFIDNFEEQLVGKNRGDEVEVNVTFPGDYHKSSLAGKAAVFKVKILEVLSGSEKKELSDEFVKNTFHMDSVEKFREMVRNELEKSNRELTDRYARLDIKNKLAEEKDFPLAETLANEKFNDLKVEKQIEELNNSTFKPIDEDDLRKKANRAVKISMLLAAIGKNSNIDVDDEELSKFIIDRAMANPAKRDEIINHFRKNPGAMLRVRDNLLENKVLDFILAEADCDEVSVSSEEFREISKARDEKLREV